MRQHRSTLLPALLLLATACADLGESESFRLHKGVEVTTRNGAVQIRMSKPVDGGTSFGLCTGALISDKCVITAGHCVEHFGQAQFKKTGEIWHPDKTNNDADGKATPAEGETVSKVAAVEVLGTSESRDLAVIRLETALPGDTLTRGTTAPKPAQDVLVYGNGTTENGKSAHRKGENGVIGIIPDDDDKDYDHYVLIASGGNQIAEGDSGGPVMFDKMLVGIVHGASPDAAVLGAATNILSKKGSAWLDAKIASVCNPGGGGTSSGGDDGSTDDGSTGDDGSTSGDGDRVGRLCAARKDRRSVHARHRIRRTWSPPWVSAPRADRRTALPCRQTARASSRSTRG